MDDQIVQEDGGGNKWKLWAILGGVGTLVVLVLIIFGLYQLGDASESALERLAEIAVIFIVLLFLIVVVLLAAVVAVLGFLVLQIKDRVIPLLEELTGTVKRVRGTADFMSEEAIKPIISIASSFSRVRAMGRTVTGKRRKP